MMGLVLNALTDRLMARLPVPGGCQTEEVDEKRRERTVGVAEEAIAAVGDAGRGAVEEVVRVALGRDGGRRAGLSVCAAVVADSVCVAKDMSGRSQGKRRLEDVPFSKVASGQAVRSHLSW